MGVVPVLRSNLEEAALPLWRFDFHQDSVPALSVYTAYTLAGWMLLPEHCDSCVLRYIISLSDTFLRCKPANECTQLAHGDLVPFDFYFIRPLYHSRVSSVA